MFFGFYEPTPVIERRGPDFFIPAHPQPRRSAPGLLQVILGARHSLIGNWGEEDYRPCVDEFRILRRQVVLVNTPEHVKQVLVTHHANYERKSPQMRRALEALIGDGLFISDGETWKRRRPLVADIVHKRRLPEFAPAMEHAALDLAEKWAALTPDDEFDVTAEMAHLTARIIARAVFGSRLAATAAQQVTQGFSAYQGSIDSFNIAYFLGADEGAPLRKTQARRAAIEKVHAVVDGVIEAHLAGEGDAGSMIDLLIRRNQRQPESELDVHALRNEAATIFMAGHETTATTLTWAWYLLANAPWVEQKLHAEIDALCGDRDVTLGDVANLDWCRSIILETLRLYPPVPLMPRQAKEADAIAGVNVEKGALVMIAPWLLHRTEGIWDRPNHFEPERFAEGRKVNPFAFIPFSVGPRICAGLNFGQDEAVLCLATLAQRFKVRPRPGYAVEPVCRLTLRPAGGLPVTVSPRPGRRRACMS